jgi:hypothetical protein
VKSFGIGHGYFSLAAMWEIAASAHSSSCMLPGERRRWRRQAWALVFGTRGVVAPRGLPTLRILLATNLVNRERGASAHFRRMFGSIASFAACCAVAGFLMHAQD